MLTKLIHFVFTEISNLPRLNIVLPRFRLPVWCFVLACCAASSSQAISSDSLTILISGGMRGRIEGCGCSSAKGGLSRRVTAMEQRFTDEYPLGIDCGGILDLDPEWGQRKSSCLLHGMARLGLKIMGVSKRDLFYGTNYIRSMADSAGIKLISANIFIDDSLIFEKWASIPYKGHNLAFTSLVDHDPENRAAILGSWYSAPVDSTLHRLSSELPDAADIIILLTDISETELKTLLEKWTFFDVVFTSSRQFYARSPLQFGETMVVQPGRDGRSIDGIVATFNNSGDNEIAFFTIPLTRNIRINDETVNWVDTCLGKYPETGAGNILPTNR